MSRTLITFATGLLLTSAAFAKTVSTDSRDSEAPEQDAPAHPSSDEPEADEPEADAPDREIPDPTRPSPSDDDDFANKGEFIQHLLDQGLRGQELADAIHDEWEKRKGPSKNEEQSRERAAKAAAKATAKQKGKPDSQPRQ